MHDKGNNAFAYEEKPGALKKRIQAHSRFSDFSLHDWIEKTFPIRPGESLLDLGCGEGNYIPLFLKKIGPEGFFAGVDKNEMMLEEARKHLAGFPPTNAVFLVRDFDRPLRLPRKNFHWIFAIYSLYYTLDSRKIVQELERTLAPGGTCAVIGPGPRNALEMIELTRQVTGREPNPENAGRLGRILQEFKPLFGERESFEKVEEHLMEHRLTFPTVESFGDYYFSTILWRETTENFPEKTQGRFRKEILEWAADRLPVTVKKEVACLAARKQNAS